MRYAALLAILTLIFVAGCQTSRTPQDRVEAGQTTAELTALIGEPDAIGQDGTWYYERPFYVLAVPVRQGRVAEEPYRTDKYPVEVAQYSSYLD